jgi:hypothetical protein
MDALVTFLENKRLPARRTFSTSDATRTLGAFMSREKNGEDQHGLAVLVLSSEFTL